MLVRIEGEAKKQHLGNYRSRIHWRALWWEVLWVETLDVPEPATVVDEGDTHLPVVLGSSGGCCSPLIVIELRHRKGYYVQSGWLVCEGQSRTPEWGIEVERGGSCLS